MVLLTSAPGPGIGCATLALLLLGREIKLMPISIIINFYSANFRSLNIMVIVFFEYNNLKLIVLLYLNRTSVTS